MIESGLLERCDARRDALDSNEKFIREKKMYAGFAELGRFSTSNSRIKNILETNYDSKEFCTIKKCEDLLEEVLENNIMEFSKSSMFFTLFSKFKYGGQLQAGHIATLISRFSPEKIYYVVNMFSYAGIGYKMSDGKSYDAYLKKILMNDIIDDVVDNDKIYALYYWSKKVHLLNKEIVSADKNKSTITDRTINHITAIAKRYTAQRIVRDFYVGFRTEFDIPIINIGHDDVHILNKTGNLYTSWETFTELSDLFLNKNKICTDKYQDIIDHIKSNVISHKEAYFRLYKIVADNFDIKPLEEEM